MKLKNMSVDNYYKVWQIVIVKWEKTKIDLDRLAQEIRNMSVRSHLYKVLKSELSKKDYWKNKKRGKPNPRDLGGY